MPIPRPVNGEPSEHGDPDEKTDTRCLIGLAAVRGFGKATLSQPGGTRKPDSIEYKIAVQRATQVAIWGMSAAGIVDILRATQRDLGGDVGDVVYFSNLMESASPSTRAGSNEVKQHRPQRVA